MASVIRITDQGRSVVKPGIWLEDVPRSCVGITWNVLNDRTGGKRERKLENHTILICQLGRLVTGGSYRLIIANSSQQTEDRFDEHNMVSQSQ